MIDHVIIKGFKSIRHLDLKLEPINVLIGANGAGKSNFISFFKLLNVLYLNDLKRYVATHGYADNFLHFGSKFSSSIEGEIVFYNEELGRKANLYSFSLVPTRNSYLIIDTETSGNFYDGNGNRNDEKWFSRDFDISNFESHVLIRSNSTRDDYLRDHFESFQIYHFHDTSDNSPLRKPCKLNDNRGLREDGSNLAAFLYYLQEKYPRKFRLIERTIKSIAPFFKQFVLKPGNLNSEMIELEWREERVPDLYMNAHNFSDGTLRMIALTTLLLQPDPPKTIIIDEPELGLHPFAVNKLAGLVRKASAKSQVIISTQSVNLVNNFEPEKIITVDREDGQSVFKRLNSNNIEEWLEAYSVGDLWNKRVIGGQP